MDENDKHSVKRRRVTKACLVCAKSRRKCDGQQPLCSTCKNQGLACSWSDVPSRRGPPKGYRRGAADPASLLPKIAKIREQVHALQVAYGERLVLSQLHEAVFGDHRACEPDWMSRAEANASVVPSGSVSAAEGSESRSPTKAKSEWSQDDQEEDHANSEVEEGSSSGMAFLATSMRYMHTDSPLTPISDSERLPMEKYNPWALRRGDRIDRHPLRRRATTPASYIPQPAPEDIEILLKTYWSAIHPHWPILYKPSFDSISIFKIIDEIPLALLYAMYALSARLVPSDTLNHLTAETFLRVAEEELRSDDPFHSDINTCTTLFFLSLYYHGEGDQRRAWVHCSIAAVMALDLGLQRGVQDLPLVEHERRVRVFWNIFVYEKVLASEMGRPVTIHMDTCNPVRLSEEQSDEYETVVHHASGCAVRLYTISVFNAAVDLFRIFERILSEIHSASSKFAVRPMRERSGIVNDLDKELDIWQRSLGPRCTYPHHDDRTPTRSLYLTHAWYHVARILVHRPLIPRSRVGHVFVSNVHHKVATEHANLLVDLLAQFAAGQEINKLPPNDTYPIFTASIIHIYNLTTANNDRALRESARPRLEQCLQWIQVLAKTWSSASQYKQLLNAFYQVASDTITHSHTLSPTVSSPGSSQNNSQMTPNTVYSRTSPSTVSYMQQDAPESSSRHNMPQPYPPQPQPPQHQQQSYPVAETEQPELFSLEAYYWNDFAAGATHQVTGYYQQPRTAEALQAPTEVYYDVLRLLHPPDGENRPVQ